MELKIGEYSFDIKLESNATAQKLLEILPLEIKMSELNGNEKYYYLNKDLPANDKEIEQIKAGDIMLWGSNCLVIFYKSFSSGYEYTKIGHIKDIANLETALGIGNIQVTWTI